jgi:hypothetical protein
MTLPDLTLTLVPAADGKQRISDPDGEHGQPPPSVGPNIYIDPVNGNDSNDWLTPETAAKNCNTVFASDVIVAGMTVNFMAGVYNHLGVQRDGVYFLVRLKDGTTGTAEAPITLQAYPGHEGRVIFEGTDPATGNPHRQSGIVIQGSYIHIKNLVLRKMKMEGIRHYSARAKQSTPLFGVVDPPAGMGSPNPTHKGIIIDSCIFYDFDDQNWDEGQWGPSGGNSTAIRIDSTENCEMLNCFASKMWSQAQNRWSGLILESYTGGYTKVTNCTTWYTQGLHFFKQHSCDPSGTSALEDGVELSYCYVEKVTGGGVPWVEIINQYCPPSVIRMHHNIIVNRWDSGNCVGYSVVADSNTYPGINRSAFSGRQYCYNNLIIPNGEPGDNAGMGTNGVGLELNGNICLNAYQWIVNSQTNYGHEGIYACDYNVLSKFDVYLKSGASESRFYNFTDWKAATTATHPHIKVDNPDSNSLEVGYTIEPFFTDFDQRDFTYAGTAPWLGMMPDGSNPGPYQNGDEVIGCRIPWFDLSDAWPDIPDWLNPGKGTNT